MKLKTLFTAVLLTSGALIGAGCAIDPTHERTVGTVVDDATIKAKVKAALLAEEDVKSFDIKVDTFDGTVQLSGFVDSQWQIDKAVAVAGGVDVVKRVKNDLIHKPRQ